MKFERPSDCPDDTFVDFTFQGETHTIFRRLLPGGKRSKNYYVKFEFGGHAVFHSLATPNRALAIAAARKKIRAAMEGHWDRLERSKLKRGMATIGDVLDAYAAGITRVNEGIRPYVAARNVTTFGNFLRWALGRDVQARAMRADALTEELVDRFRENYLAPSGEDKLAREGRKRGGAAVLRQTRSIFSKRAMKLYKDMELPDVQPFMRAASFTAKNRKIVPILPEAIAEIGRAALALRETRPGLYLAHLCFKFLGMRNVEIRAARWEWIERQPDRSGLMVIDVRPDYDPKGNQGSVPIVPEVLAEMDRVRANAALGKGPLPDDYLIPAATPTERGEIVDREHSEFMRRFLAPDKYAKSSYELRRWANSAIFRKYGEAAEGAFVRHAPESVSERFYRYGFRWNELSEKFPGPIGITFADAGM